MSSTPARAVLGTALIGLAVGLSGVAHAEPRDGSVGPSAGEPARVGSIFQAKRELESMGLRDLMAFGGIARGTAEVAGSGNPGASANLHTARVIAPTLAFLHGLCDGGGGLPRFGDAIGVALRPGALVELRATGLGQLLGVDNRPSRVWICDPAKIGALALVRRAGDSEAR